MSGIRGASASPISSLKAAVAVVEELVMPLETNGACEGCKRLGDARQRRPPPRAIVPKHTAMTSSAYLLLPRVAEAAATPRETDGRDRYERNGPGHRRSRIHRLTRRERVARPRLAGSRARQPHPPSARDRRAAGLPERRRR